MFLVVSGTGGQLVAELKLSSRVLGHNDGIGELGGGHANQGEHYEQLHSGINVRG